eukprot:TRINITY_DN2527_c0_g2_i6.p1 TRINITY_DN2527_c0_g2~~TRINITY_DN2527_c0_g2_i6.p1  ORF type:complete len:287 (-),score=48.33 TRINITY_DN2527_c0_g2_i6:236-1096(-)
MQEQISKLQGMANKPSRRVSEDFDESAMEVEILTKEIMDLRDELENTTLRYTEHLTEKVTLTEQLQKDLDKFKSENQHLNTELEALKEATQAARIENDAVKDQIKIVEAQKELMADQLESTKSSITSRGDMELQKDRFKRASRKGTAGRYMSSEDLEKLKEKEKALQTHNSFLGEEIKRREVESQVKNDTIKRLQTELKEAQSGAFTGVVNGKDVEDLYKQLDHIRSKYFISTAVGVKVQGAQLGWYANVDVHQLYERALNSAIPLEQWAEWITDEIKKASLPMEE